MQPWPHAEEPETLTIGRRVVVRKVFMQPDGKKAEYYTRGAIDSRSGAVIALTKDNKVVIAEQFRQGPEKVRQDLPGGGIGSDEDPQEAVMRELREETGYASDNVTFLGTTHNQAYDNTTMYFYLARNCYKLHDQSLDDGEFVQVKEITVDQLFENARNDRMGAVDGLFLAYEELQPLLKRGRNA